MPTTELVPGDVRQINFPTDLKPEWKIALAGYPQPSVTVDDATGNTLRVKLGKGGVVPFGVFVRQHRLLA